MWKTFPSVDALRRGWTDVGGVRSGFGFLLRGAVMLFRTRHLWPLLIAPVLTNAILFASFLIGASTLLRGVFSALHPEVWWQTALVAMVVMATVGAIAFIGSAIVVSLGSVISAPFYDAIAQQVTRRMGGIVVEHAWWSHVWPSMRHAAVKLWWYLLLQAGLVILYIVPGAFGPIAFVTIGYVATVFFLALDFLDFSFDFVGWTFAERRDWCLEHKGLMLGFGSAIFLGLCVPAVNLFVPPIAVVGSAILFFETYVPSDAQRPR